MSLKLVLEGLGILVLGLFNVVWYIVKIVSCIGIAVLISTKLGLTNYYWWFGLVIIIALLNKIIFWGNDDKNKNYSDLVDEYKNKAEELESENEMW